MGSSRRKRSVIDVEATEKGSPDSDDVFGLEAPEEGSAPKLRMEDLPTRSRPEGKSIAELTEEALKGVESELYQQAMEVMVDQLYFNQINPAKDTGPPPEWIEELGHKRANERFRIAQASWMNSRDAPVGLRNTTQLVLGMLKARAVAKAGARSLNIAVVAMPMADAPPPTFEELEIDGE